MSHSSLIDPELGKYTTHGNQLTYQNTNESPDVRHREYIPPLIHKTSRCTYLKRFCNCFLLFITITLLGGSLYTSQLQDFKQTNLSLFIFVCMIHSITRLQLSYSLYRLYSKKKISAVWWFTLVAFLSEIVIVSTSLLLLQNNYFSFQNETNFLQIYMIYTGLQVFCAVFYLLLLFTAKFYYSYNSA